MYKNQLQELAQRSCFNIPSYTCIREGPDHAPRFKATVNFNGEIFESPHYCSTLRQAELSAAEVALNSLSHRAPSHSLAARILDETGVYKNLLQEIAQRVGASLPQYFTFRSGLGHLPVFTGTVKLAGIMFTGEPAKNKKQAEKNAAMAAWSSLKQCKCLPAFSLDALISCKRISSFTSVCLVNIASKYHKLEHSQFPAQSCFRNLRKKCGLLRQCTACFFRKFACSARLSGVKAKTMFNAFVDPFSM
ncbi:double-stranded RNA-binding protein 2 [Cajanus cajan]|uniref:DRBM domain-containing protein n=1 Tax=Cajanus cajan TaxID=3821 RepID=A0A151TN33_CAJCA|nr:double-stranded RNA-binding protein 2 [Cajanus cajan]KYP68453.1 hypothetical protein KK1_022079 [Cajanus cajan]